MHLFKSIYTLLAVLCLMCSSNVYAMGGSHADKDYENRWIPGVSSLGAYFGGKEQVKITFSCDDPNAVPNIHGVCACKTGYMEKEGICQPDACAGFVASECIPACQDVNDQPVYTYADTCHNGDWVCDEHHKCQNPCNFPENQRECQTCIPKGDMLTYENITGKSCTSVPGGVCKNGNCVNPCDDFNPTEGTEDYCKKCIAANGKKFMVYDESHNDKSCGKNKICYNGCIDDPCAGKTKSCKKCVVVNGRATWPTDESLNNKPCDEDGTCIDGECTPNDEICSATNLDPCEEDECANVGGHWDENANDGDGGCVSQQSTCSADNLDACPDLTTCENAGGYWCMMASIYGLVSETCVPTEADCVPEEDTCSADNLDACDTQTACTTAGGIWDKLGEVCEENWCSDNDSPYYVIKKDNTGLISKQHLCSETPCETNSDLEFHFDDDMSCIYCGTGLKWDDNEKDCVPDDDTCSANNLDACDSTNCATAGGIWDRGTEKCKEILCSEDNESPYYMIKKDYMGVISSTQFCSETSCETAQTGLQFHFDGDHSCFYCGTGLKWDDNEKDCVPDDDTCSADELYTCNSQTACTTAGGYWCEKTFYNADGSSQVYGECYSQSESSTCDCTPNSMTNGIGGWVPLEGATDVCVPKCWNPNTNKCCEHYLRTGECVVCPANAIWDEHNKDCQQVCDGGEVWDENANDGEGGCVICTTTGTSGQLGGNQQCQTYYNNYFARHVCNPETNDCVECLTDADCTSTTGLQNPAPDFKYCVNKRCIPCKTDYTDGQNLANGECPQSTPYCGDNGCFDCGDMTWDATNRTCVNPTCSANNLDACDSQTACTDAGGKYMLHIIQGTVLSNETWDSIGYLDIPSNKQYFCVRQDQYCKDDTFIGGTDNNGNPTCFAQPSCENTVCERVSCIDDECSQYYSQTLCSTNCPTSCAATSGYTWNDQLNRCYQDNYCPEGEHLCVECTDKNCTQKEDYCASDCQAACAAVQNYTWDNEQNACIRSNSYIGGDGFESCTNFIPTTCT
ncbi:MAG: hypothetical protein II942_03585, partial [Alphaproteobacteria bacterium]|nr:hypothetical protein [Alphaproteobacteria bacterium]